jgi:uncharacterized linocin/CFP29 family protein
MNDYLTREGAPISEEAWQALDRTAVEAAKSVLSGRRLLHIEGPYGLGLKAIPLADQQADKGMVIGCTLPLALVQRSFTMAKRDFAAAEGGALLDTSPVATAAIECAMAEDSLVFGGAPGIPGLLTIKGSAGQKLSPWDEVGTAASDIIKAVTVLDSAGFHGPYVLALSPARYNLLLRRYPTGNFSELEHIQSMATEGVVKAPALEGGGLLLASGRQFAAIIIGQDMTVGFTGPAEERLEFTVSESLVPFIREPRALCVLKE